MYETDRKPLSAADLFPNLLVRSLIDELLVRCKYGLKVLLPTFFLSFLLDMSVQKTTRGKLVSSYEHDEALCTELVKFGYRYATRNTSLTLFLLGPALTRTPYSHPY